MTVLEIIVALVAVSVFAGVFAAGITGGDRPLQNPISKKCHPGERRSHNIRLRVRSREKGVWASAAAMWRPIGAPPKPAAATGTGCRSRYVGKSGVNG